MLLSAPECQRGKQYATVSHATTIPEPLPLVTSPDVLSEVLRNGAQQMLAQAIQAEQSVDPANLPKMSLLAKTTVSAPVVSKILQAHGIDASEQEVKELPMDTEVYNSLDQPDVGEAANDPLTEAEAAQAMQMAEDKHLSEQAKAAASMGQMAHNVSLTEEKHQQQMRHAEEQHLTKLQHAERSQREKERAARESKQSSDS